MANLILPIEERNLNEVSSSTAAAAAASCSLVIGLQTLVIGTLLTLWAARAHPVSRLAPSHGLLGYDRLHTLGVFLSRGVMLRRGSNEFISY